MFNILVSGTIDSWENGEYTFERGRVAIEYTSNELSERYRELDATAIEELQNFPTLFMIEREEGASHIGKILSIVTAGQRVTIRFEMDESIPALDVGTIDRVRASLDIGRWELYRTHWAVKNVDLVSVLIQNEIISEEVARSSNVFRSYYFEPTRAAITGEAEPLQRRRVFLVHGQDEIAKLDVKNFLVAIGLDPVIMQAQASAGMTIIEKLEANADVIFAVILYTPCDMGARYFSLNLNLRARQNVVFEHGFFTAKLGRSRVVALKRNGVELPNDFSGVIFVEFDDSNRWKSELVREMNAVGLEVREPA
ncbi:MAG: nucleotide-binding protein [bacterium]|nr:nucleotide-binding protein [bacterium]